MMINQSNHASLWAAIVRVCFLAFISAMTVDILKETWGTFPAVFEAAKNELLVTELFFFFQDLGTSPTIYLVTKLEPNQTKLKH